MIIALDFKYEQRSPRSRSPSQRFLSAACIYHLAPLLIYSDLTKLSKNALVERSYAIGRFVAFSGRGGRPITAKGLD